MDTWRPGNGPSSEGRSGASLGKMGIALGLAASVAIGLPLLMRSATLSAILVLDCVALFCALVTAYAWTRRGYIGRVWVLLPAAFTLVWLALTCLGAYSAIAGSSGGGVEKLASPSEQGPSVESEQYTTSSRAD